MLLLKWFMNIKWPLRAMYHTAGSVEQVQGNTKSSKLEVKQGPSLALTQTTDSKVRNHLLPQITQ